MENFKSILITGGTGSFGKAFLSRILRDDPKKRVVVFSRDELKQYDLSVIYPPEKFPNLRFFLGDVRDYRRLYRAFENVDLVIHAAALKQVPAAEYNPFEFIKTNIIGAQNVIDAAIEANVKKVIALSTDKASAPLNLYGATKLCSDKLFVAANNIKGTKEISFSVVRYGNVLGSRGSVIPYFLNMKNSLLKVTDPNMTRFSLTLEEGVNLVMWAVKNSIGGELFIPKISSYKLEDLVEIMKNGRSVEYIGIRPGEKMHESMITKDEAANTYSLENMYVILEHKNTIQLKHYESIGAIKVDKDFSYSSENNRFYNREELNELINNLK